MTLCISCGVIGGEILTIADTQITTTTKADNGSDLPTNDDFAISFLPSNTKISHKYYNGIKIHIASKNSELYSYSGGRLDVVISIAGNVLLGLQCAIYLDAYLKVSYATWPSDIISAIKDKLHGFWWSARDKDIELSIAFADHKQIMHLYEAKGSPNGIEFSEVYPENGILLSVIGDNCHEIRKAILTKTSSLYYSRSLEDALKQASVSLLSDAIESESEIFVGGIIQATRLTRWEAEYLYVTMRHNPYFRGIDIADFELHKPSTLDIDGIRTAAGM